MPVAVAILLSIAAALAFAAVYAVFGRPSSHIAKRRKKQVQDGFRLAGGVLLGMMLMGCVIFGADIASNGGSPKVPRPVAGLIAIVAFIAIAALVQRWAKYFAGFVIWGVYNSLIVASTGHALNSPSVPVSRWYAFGVGAVYLFSVLPTARFASSYKLHFIEKVALLAWILAFAAAVLFPQMNIAILCAGDAALVVAWLWYHFHRHRHGAQSTQGRTRSTVA